MKLKFLLSFGLSVVFASVVCAQDAGKPVDIDVTKAKGYLFGPGDEIIGRVGNEDEYNFTTSVNEDGTIEVPFSETPVVARCKTIRELRSELTDQLAKYLKKPQLGLQMKSNSRPPITVSGEVREAQKLIALRKVTLLDMLTIAGGPTDEAGSVVKVSRPQPPPCSAPTDDGNWKPSETDLNGVPSRTYSIADVMSGKETANPIIYPGDLIFVDKAKPVYVIGEVLSPQGVYLKEGMSLAQAIARVGGPKREAKTKAVTIHRRKPGSENDSELISANYDLIIKGKEKDVLLQPYDIIEVDHAKKSIAQQIAEIAVGAGKTGISGLANAGSLKILY